MSSATHSEISVTVYVIAMMMLMEQVRQRFRTHIIYNRFSTHIKTLIDVKYECDEAKCLYTYDVYICSYLVQFAVPVKQYEDHEPMSTQVPNGS